MCAAGWNGYRREEIEREKKKSQKIDHGEENFPPLLPGLEPATFRSGVRRSITGLSPLPMSEELPPAVFDEQPKSIPSEHLVKKGLTDKCAEPPDSIHSERLVRQVCRTAGQYPFGTTRQTSVSNRTVSLRNDSSDKRSVSNNRTVSLRDKSSSQMRKIV